MDNKYVSKMSRLNYASMSYDTPCIELEFFTRESSMAEPAEIEVKASGTICTSWSAGSSGIDTK